MSYKVAATVRTLVAVTASNTHEAHEGHDNLRVSSVIWDILESYVRRFCTDKIPFQDKCAVLDRRG
jgi:hypothetical protein